MLKTRKVIEKNYAKINIKPSEPNSKKSNGNSIDYSGYNQSEHAENRTEIVQSWWISNSEYTAKEPVPAPWFKLQISLGSERLRDMLIIVKLRIIPVYTQQTHLISLWQTSGHIYYLQSCSIGQLLSGAVSIYIVIQIHERCLSWVSRQITSSLNYLVLKLVLNAKWHTWMKGYYL